MALTPDEVRHIAHLARLGLTDADVAKFAPQLSEILDYFDRLKAVDTAGIPPTAYPLDLHNILRDDVPDPPSDPETILKNAPNREGNLLRVRAILDE
ncbi:MAG: Asp-tRNA(Asn)/Glu-tRNA(Gln) amidotransferase subunit GatC [Chloroflexota bacterium]